jgi:hypothetical protein
MEAKDVWATFARGVCMQGLQEVHAQETDACQPAMLCYPAERRGCEGRAGSHRRDECRDELHLSRAPGHGAQRVWGMPGRADAGEGGRSAGSRLRALGMLLVCLNASGIRAMRSPLHVCSFPSHGGHAVVRVGVHVPEISSLFSEQIFIVINKS